MAHWCLSRDSSECVQNKHVLLNPDNKTRIVPSTWESEAGELEQVSVQPVLCGETLSQKAKKNYEERN